MYITWKCCYLNHPPFRQYFWYFLFVLLFCLISWVYFCIFFLCCFALCKSFLVVHHEIFCLSYLLSWYTHTPKGVCVYIENTSDLWDIPWYSMVPSIQKVFLVIFTCTIILFDFLSVYLTFAFFLCCLALLSWCLYFAYKPSLYANVFAIIFLLFLFSQTVLYPALWFIFGICLLCFVCLAHFLFIFTT